MTIYQKHVEFRCIECVHGHILGTPFTYIQKKKLKQKLILPIFTYLVTKHEI